MSSSNNNDNNLEIIATATTTKEPSASAASAVDTASTTTTTIATTSAVTATAAAAATTTTTSAASVCVVATANEDPTVKGEGGEESKQASKESTPGTPPPPSSSAVVSVSKENHHQPAAKESSSTKGKKEPKPLAKKQVTIIGRRSTRILEHDPIIAPGYGTRRDLVRLTAQLNNNSSSSTSGNENSGTTPALLPFEAVELIMKSRGRGIRSSSRTNGDADADAAAAAPAGSSSSAWADFMQEEGFGGGGGGGGSSSKKEDSDAAAAAKAEEKSSARKRPARTTAVAATVAATADHDDDYDDEDENAKRVYVLPPAWQEFDSFTSSSRGGAKSKKTKTTDPSGAGTSGGGILVQAGTLDATIVGRKSIGGGGTGGGGVGKKKKGATKAAAAAPAAAVATEAAALYHCMSPTRLSLGTATAIHVEKVFTSCNSVHTIALANNGTAVYGWGRNESQQLTAHLPSSSVPFPTLLSDFLPDDVAKTVGICSAATGKSHTVLLTRDGTAYAVGSNKVGQCAVKSSMETMSQFKRMIVDDGNDNDSITLVQVACGEDFTMALDSSGYLYSAGCSQYGQLGNGETGEYFITANKLAFANCTSLKRRSTFCQEDTFSAAASSRNSSSNKDQKIVPILQEDDLLIQQVVCGKHHTVAVEASCTNKKIKPRVFTWGCGDYGCLGHGVQKDEYFPRLLDTIDRMAQIQGSSLTVAAGAHCGLLLTQAGHVYYWGKHRSVGEAVMRPQIVDALANNQHHVTHCAAGAATVICCTVLAQTVAWGQGPHGELGFGTSKKSSSKPDFVDALHGCRVLDLAAGYGHTVYVIGSQDAEDRKALEKLDEIEQGDVQDLMDAAQDKQDVDDAAPKKKAGKKRG